MEIGVNSDSGDILTKTGRKAQIRICGILIEKINGRIKDIA